MRKRKTLLFASIAVIVGVAAVASQRGAGEGRPPDLERALQAGGAAPPVAVLLEMGGNDAKPADWSGQAEVTGAKVAGREGYRFRKGDKLVGPNAWKAQSRYSIRAPGNNPVIRRMEGVASVGVVFHLTDVKDGASITVSVPSLEMPPEKVELAKVLAGEAVELFGKGAVLRRVSAAVPVATGPTEDDQPAAAYGPNGTLWVAYTSYTLRDRSRTIEQHDYKEQPESFRGLYHPGFSEQLFLRSYKSGKWGEPVPVTGPKEDIARCAVAVTGDNVVWAIYSAHRDGNFDIYARPVTPKQGEATLGKEERLTTSPGPDLSPAACADSFGDLHVTYQAWAEDGKAELAVVDQKGGEWAQPRPVVRGYNCWHPAIAAGPDGKVAVACDHFDLASKSYDVIVATMDYPARGMTVHPFATGPAFQARPSLTYDKDGNLWLAHEVGPDNWGQDYGALDSKEGNPLYNARTVEVACLPKGSVKFTRPAAELPGMGEVEPPQLPFDAVKTNQFERRPRYAYPKIGVDGQGRVWLTYRRNFGSRYSSHPGAYWLTFARRLDGGAWTPEMEVIHSDGLLDHRPALLPHAAGGLVVVHNTDGRYTTPEVIDNEIYLSFVDLPGDPVAAEFRGGGRLAPLGPGGGKLPADVQRIRAYRVESGGKELQLVRGEYHRHTEISWDGAADGSLEDMFRYAIDAAALDWIGVTDHDNGAGREYPWWLTQKWSDAYHVAGKFAPMFSYERSVSYPHGHRNVLFARRGVMTLPRLAADPDGEKVAGIHPDDTKMLYRYLHELGGVCSVHTSATGMGTDWRDNDPVVEPIVEIYQGDRMSYEQQGAPRAGYDPKTGKEPANVAGWYPLGFLDHALKDKGYKLAFQSSSDHWSTHISYFVALAEGNDRESLLDAVRKRHTYGATDNIIVDLRSGKHIQGDEFATDAAPALQFHVVGTGKIEKIDVLKDSDVVKTFRPDGDSFRGDWTDPEPDARQHYYYIRVLQSDGEVAWGSPLWITRRK